MLGSPGCANAEAPTDPAELHKKKAPGVRGPLLMETGPCRQAKPSNPGALFLFLAALALLTRLVLLALAALFLALLSLLLSLLLLPLGPGLPLALALPFVLALLSLSTLLLIVVAHLSLSNPTTCRSGIKVRAGTSR